jgi:hypothetical protein
MHLLPCFASPAVFNPRQGSPCRGCAAFADCGKQSLAKVRAYAKTHPLADLAQYLEDELKRAGALPPGQVGDGPTPLPEATVALTVDVPGRTFERVTRKELLDEEKAFLERLPVKVATRMRGMLKRGRFVEIRDGLAAGKNLLPESTMPYLRLGADLLLNGGRIAKADMRRLFMERYGWTEGTAFSRVAITCRVLLEFGAATDEGNVLIRRQNSKSKIEP